MSIGDTVSALEGLRRQIEATHSAIDEVLEKIQDLSARVGVLEEDAARPTATTSIQPSRVTTPPAQSVNKSASASVSTQKSATGKP